MGVDTRRCASENAGSRMGLHWGVSHRLERGTSAIEDAGPEAGWIMRSHLGWRRHEAFLQGCENLSLVDTF